MKHGERIGHVGSLVETIPCADATRQLATTRPVVGMDVCVDDVGQAKTLGIRELNVGINIVGACIDSSACTDGPATEDVRGTAEIVVVVRSEDHCSTPGSSPAATGRPAARHSGNPSFRRRARLPLASSNSTARSAYTQYGPRQYAT